VRVERDSQQQAPAALHFAVADTGVGIPADQISTIFDSFTQADASTTRAYGGTGLGLAISKRFVELMGGRIWAESVPGEGSTIHFTARFAVADGALQPEATPAQSPGQVSALRILLADDSADNRFLIRGYLKGTGCSIDEVENGVQAVEKFEHSDYDVILMDAEMPGMDGYSATRAMRALEKERGRSETPILALTAHAQKEARDRSFEAGCTDHLTKPIQKAVLLEAIYRHAPRPATAPRIHVAVESWLKPVIPAYLEKRRADVPKLRSALEQGDYDSVRTLGHQMSGSGSGYGFTEITDIGGMLEESALDRDAVRIQHGIEALDEYLRNVLTE
jgi:CheY-like chemotaxis protein